MPRPFTGAFAGKAKILLSPPQNKMPCESWWLKPDFYENAAKERDRMRGSWGEKATQQVLSTGAEKYLGKLGG